MNMERSQSVLLNVWQEACRHIDIGQATANIAALLVQHLPIDQIVVRRVDRAKPCLETVAVGLTDRRQLSNARTDCSPMELEAILAWCRQGKIVRRENHPSIANVVFGPFNGDVLAGPLGDPAGNCGVLLFLASPEKTFDADDIALSQLLLESFSVALENDLRVREMAALREAAEADNRSLLMRLGRKTLGDTIVGVDSGLRAVMDRVELVARSDAPVLIFGETGTGKELVARAIHNRSSRSNGPFDRVNCGAIPPELIDSQLFGHEKGAFTGAVESRRGWFERADGGTLFLDEIGELPLAAQVRMLRILQDGWMERVGGEKAINVDVRIVAATHRDLASMVAEGRFREDLWYRIAVFPIVLPPLRERREDIPKLAMHFASRAATRFGLAPATPTAEDLKLLMDYAWPGNVRELGAVIDRAAILGDGKRLEVAIALGVDASASNKSGVGGRVSPWNGSSRTSPSSPESIDSLDDAIRRHIEMALTAAHGRIEGRQGAAAMLKINPHTLRAKMRKLKIDWAKFRKD
jgi:transcriptional regulator with GAF, ATPase, and Fis domain